jgi:copper chaperone CopZ
METTPAWEKREEDITMTSKTVKVPNITCGHCVKTIEREVGELNGVASVKAGAQDKVVTIEWNEKTIDWSAIQSLLKEINYPPED